MTDQENVLRVQQKFWEGLQNKDASILNEIIAEDFVLRTPNEPNQNKTEFIESLLRAPIRVHSIGSDDLQAHIFASVAVITGVQSAQIELPDARVIADRIAITNVLQQRDGRWLIKLAHPVQL
jgi:ketosteroid isomerase-like protein